MHLQRQPSPTPPGGAEPFLRKRLAFLSFWDKIWQRVSRRTAPPGPGAPTPLPQAQRPSPSQNPESLSAPQAQLFHALYDFTARREEELSVSRGDRLYALKEEGDYIFARRLSGPPSTGLVPINYVAKATPETRSDRPWYFCEINRTQAQQLLLSPANAPGAFLIRPSESSLGDYSLSVRAQAKVCHYRISTAPGGSLYLQEGRLFPSLEALLTYYKANWKLIQNPLLQPCVPQGNSRQGPEWPSLQRPPALYEWERPRSEFVLGKKLGEGCFGQVWEGLWHGSVPVAVKIIKSASSPAANMKMADLSKEIEVLKTLRHERLIRLYAVCSHEEPVYIVTELMRKGNLQSYLASPEGQALSLPLLLSFACQVAEGMGYLEEQRVVHRDLAARNVLVGDDLTCKVADFGLARLLKDDIYSPSSGFKIPVKWTAPEAANYRIFTQKSDVWSFGILLYEVFTYGQGPYEGMSNQETLQQISRGYRLPCPAACPVEVYTLMLRCWKDSPEERPTFAMLWEKLGTMHRCLHLGLL
ncbi:tyrosine-protein kinase Srms isoform X3 [Sciurus carolinensis]|uniref:tyrosine-protein kinase Srms isoform X3 n=1 Tax=Sciurus carolinensis TaxID=30640 RepID=UPI001FB23957|nr:tyrosine-protein kinase Srms isoform X3 [Sciurus carolinensis]